MKAALSWTCSARCRKDWNRQRRSLHLLQPRLLVASQVTVAWECGWGAWMTSSASGASGVVANILNYFGREKEKKKTKPQEFQSPSFSSVKFVSWLWNVKCSVPIVDTDQPKSGEEPAGVRHLRTRPVGEKSYGPSEFLWQIRGNISKTGTSGEGRFFERRLGALIGLQL